MSLHRLDLSQQRGDSALPSVQVVTLHPDLVALLSERPKSGVLQRAWDALGPGKAADDLFEGQECLHTHLSCG